MSFQNPVTTLVKEKSILNSCHTILEKIIFCTPLVWNKVWKASVSYFCELQISCEVEDFCSVADSKDRYPSQVFWLQTNQYFVCLSKVFEILMAWQMERHIFVAMTCWLCFNLDSVGIIAQWHLCWRWQKTFDWAWRMDRSRSYFAMFLF
jgi:hypothetical protein